ncbi:MAG: hypothetical protein KME01_10085 [Chroococcus sp. CMT-3BRIN-NPC107]|nr:hypothetical protein [Chroococcus sp. CMT-3BRIN-NPC107]
MWILLTVSILALIASGGAIALSILKNKDIDSTKSLIEKYDHKLKSLENKYTELLTSQTNLLSNQQRESISISSATSQNSIYLEATIERLSERISELENKSEVAQNSLQSINHSKSHSYNLEPDFNPFNLPVNLSKSGGIQNLENLAYIELVNTYNSNPKLLEQKAIRVSEPTDSIARRHTDSSQKIVLEKANNSNYWVIHDDGCVDCWLLPKSKLRIDQFRYETTKALFECNGYHPEYSTFKLVKPAKVIPLSADEQTWQLEEPGILEFSV